MENLCCAREHSVQFFVHFFLHSYTAQFNLEGMGPFKKSILKKPAMASFPIYHKWTLRLALC